MHFSGQMFQMGSLFGLGTDERRPQGRSWRRTSRTRSRSITPAGRRRCCSSPITPATGCRGRSAGWASPKPKPSAISPGTSASPGSPALLADALDAMLIQQNYSRLVIDCNRPPGIPAQFRKSAKLTPIPGNVGLSEAAKGRARARNLLALSRTHRSGAGTPRAKPAAPTRSDRAAQLHAGVQGRSARLACRAPLQSRSASRASAPRAAQASRQGLIVGDNEPYHVSDTTDFTIPVHGERHGLPHALIEIRQDLIADESGQQQWAALLARLLPQAYAEMAGKRNPFDSASGELTSSALARLSSSISSSSTCTRSPSAA